jgi:hypothetical protein
MAHSLTNEAHGKEFLNLVKGRQMISEMYRISRITSTTIDSLNNDHLPLFIACIRKDENYHEILINLLSIAEYFSGRVMVFYALEDMFFYFRDTYNIKGTPTYLILHVGKILDIVLGNCHYNLLIERINKNLQGLKSMDERYTKSGDVV